MPLLENEIATAKTTINGLMPRSAQSFFEIGTVLKELVDKVNSFEGKDKDLAKIEYDSFVLTLPFGQTVAKKFVAIASDEVLGANLEFVPFAYNTMYALRGFEQSDFDKMIELGLNTFTTAKQLSEIRQTMNPTATDEDIQSAREVLETLPSTKKRNKLKESDFSELKFGDDTVTEPLVIVGGESIVIDIDPSKLTAFEVTKLNDLVAKIEKLKFTSDKGVNVSNGYNPYVLNDRNSVAVAS